MTRRTTRPLTLAEQRRAIQLLAEGMPAGWIAEDFDVPRKAIQSLTPPNPEAAREWRSVWASIRHRPPLAALHREFAPSLAYRS